MTIEAKNRALAKEYSELKDTIAPLEKRVKELKKYFDEMTGKETTDLGTWLIKYVVKNSRVLDVDRLAAEHPEINLEDYKVNKETRALYVESK